MSILLKCPHCSAKLRSKKDPGNRQVTCLKCQKGFLASSNNLQPESDSVALELVSEVADGSNAMGSRLNSYSSTPLSRQGQKQFQISNQDIGKIEVIIQEGRGVLYAFLICFFLVFIGSFIIIPWYYMRLKAWKMYSEKYTFLLDENAVYGSFAWAFQITRRRLIIGFVIAIGLLGFYALLFLPFLLGLMLGVH